MTIQDRILVKLQEIGKLEEEEGIVAGIAQRAIDFGYDSLTARQQAVISHLLSENCTGVIDPADYHNGCEVELEDDDLLEALEESADAWAPQCSNCREEEAELDRQREKFFAD